MVSNILIIIIIVKCRGVEETEREEGLNRVRESGQERERERGREGGMCVTGVVLDDPRKHGVLGDVVAAAARHGVQCQNVGVVTDVPVAPQLRQAHVLCAW